METNTIVALLLAGFLLFIIGGYVLWMKSQDQTKSLEGEIVYSAQPHPVIINHTSTNLSLVPKPAIERAIANLHIVYGHTSHGSQITDGMTGLSHFSPAPYESSLYIWNDGGTNGALDLRDGKISGDLGSPDRTS
jgi:hypothetical protein